MLRLGRQVIQKTQGFKRLSLPLSNSQTRGVWMEWTYIQINGQDEEEDDDNDTKTVKEQKEKKSTLLPQEQSQQSQASK